MFKFTIRPHACKQLRLTLILVVMMGMPLFSQVFYSTDKKYLASKQEQTNNLISSFNYTYPDTSINELSNYFPRNFLGNTGLPSPNYLFNYGTDYLGFRFFESPNLNDCFYERDIFYYLSKGPYAHLEGIAGSKQLQIFKMLFTQTYKNRLNITLRFNRYTSLGFYQKQQTYTNNFNLSSHFVTAKKRFGYYFYALNNGNKNSENGGIRDNALNDSTVLLNKELMNVKLSSANRDNRELKLMLNPWLRLNTSTDTINNTAHYLQLKSGFVTSSYRYKDLGIVRDNFYKKVYFDTVKTLDSSHLMKVFNELNYVLRGPGGKLNFSAGYKNEFNQLWQKSNSTFINHILKSDFLFSPKAADIDSAEKRRFTSQCNLQYVLSGFNSGNYKAENRNVYYLNPKQHNFLSLSLLAERRSPDYMYTTWASNHFLWVNNTFLTQQQFQANVAWSFKNRVSFGAFYQNLFNYLYFNQETLPAQYKKTIENLGLSARFSFLLFKHLGIYVDHQFQHSSKPGYYRVPQHISTARLFYNGHLFKNNLHLQIGSQVQVYQSFKALAYMPSTQAFYLQDNTTTAACPFLDVYLNARVRPVTIFLKVENALQGLVGNNYSFVPGYYQPDRALRFGISWQFYD